MADTKADLQAENERLQAENDALRAELDQLSKVAADPAAAAAEVRARRPEEPSFGMSEGMRAELEQTGSTTSPFTGKIYKAGDDGEPVEQPAAVADTPDSDQQ